MKEGTMRRSPAFCLAITDELELRLHERRFVDELFALTERNRAYLREWMPWAVYESSIKDTQAYMEQAVRQFANNEGLETGIWYQGQLVGSIGLHSLDWANQKGEIGYWLDAAMQGKGIVTTACRALVNYAFDQYHLNKVEILCAPGNSRSRAIPERLGFTLEGTIRQAERFPDHYNDLAIYGMLASEWKRE
jgi:ribosomal-protein-serine acetyltransferase